MMDPTIIMILCYNIYSTLNDDSALIIIKKEPTIIMQMFAHERPTH